MATEQVSPNSKRLSDGAHRAMTTPPEIYQALASHADIKLAGHWRESATAVDRAIANLYRKTYNRARLGWFWRLLRR